MKLFSVLFLFGILLFGCEGPESAESVSPEVFQPFVVEVGQDTDGQDAREPKPEPDVKEEPTEPTKIEPPKPAPAPKPKKKKRGKRKSYKPAVLQIVTNFDKADATVNGRPYPEYIGTEDSEGMVLPAGGPYTVEVKQGSKSKTYRLHLRPYETRMLFVELSGLSGNRKAPSKPSKPLKKEESKKQETKKEDKKDDENGKGKVTVYAKPAGVIMVDGKSVGENTPGTIELDNGRHVVQVEYEDGQISEKKTVRVRDNSKIRLFFRQRKK